MVCMCIKPTPILVWVRTLALVGVGAVELHIELHTL
jgi:hypothetical protein